MKPKALAVLAALLLFVGIGTAAYAAEVGPAVFREMLPFMQEMHPDLNDSELEQMYTDCHGPENGDYNSQRMMHENSMYHNSMHEDLMHDDSMHNDSMHNDSMMRNNSTHHNSMMHHS
jgi:hypothetical protein